MRINTFISAIAIMALTTGCSILRNNQSKTPPTTASSTATNTTATTQTSKTETPALDDIIDNMKGEWSIVEVNGTKVTVNGENHPKITLNPAESRTGVMEVIGFNGCNYLNGMWNIKENKITPSGEFISTLKACPDAPYEFAVSKAINEVASYKLSDASNMSLLSSDGRVVMKLHKQNLAFLNGAWKVTAIEGKAITAKIKIVIDVEEKRVHGNAGCNLINGEIIVNLDKGNGIEFKNLATSRMICPDIATEQAFLLALENVDTAAEGETTNQAVLKDNDGKTILSLTRLSPDEIAD